MKTTGSFFSLAVLGTLPLFGVSSADAQTIYWTDVGASKIQRANLEGGAGVEDLLTIGVVFTPVGIALDVPGGKMYWTEASPADFMIQRADLDCTNLELLVTALVNPSGIALDVAGGKMYWTDIGTCKIPRANLDGSEAEDLVTTGVIEPVGVTLDVPAGKMYWTEASPADFMISRANLDGSNRELLITGLTSPSGIALDLSSSAACPADLDGDGNINAADLAQLLASWGPCVGCPADFNADRVVDAADLAQLLSVWGTCS